MQALSKRFEFDESQQTTMHSLIVRHSLFAKSAAPDDWVQSRLAELRDDELTEIYLRSTIGDADWPSFRVAYEWLSAERQASDEWRYWRVMAAAPGEAERSEAELNTLAAGRGFHAYLAAEILSLPPGLASDDIVAPPFIDSDVVARVRELIAVGMIWEARSEFRAALDDPAVALSLADLAAESGWHSLAIEAAAAAKAWGRVDLRFPVVYQTEFSNASEESGLDVEELFAVARRESAMAPDAVSEVGARGLMQLMPSTARLTARKHNYRYSRSRLMRPGYNTAVGALYYADLIKQYDGNRVLALAAYNAGPNRVRRWSEGTMSVARWVDTIPFKETREYVRAVLAYSVIYRLKAGKAANMLTDMERDFLY
jgi:soluble lytic murein transglycosylase